MRRIRVRPPLRSNRPSERMSGEQKAGRKEGRRYFHEYMENGLYNPLPSAPYNGALQQTDWIRGFLETADGETR